MSVLTEFKGCQKRAFDNAMESEAFNAASDRMDVLWVQLSTEEAIKAQKYERQLWIDSDRAID
jgi:hypothetical protein